MARFWSESLTYFTWQKPVFDNLSDGSSSKKVSLLACGREDDQKGDEGEGLEKITEAEKGALRRGAGRGGVISQNWRDRTSAFFAVLGS